MSNMARERCPGVNPAKEAGRVKKEERTQKEEDSRKEEHIIEGGRKLEKPAEKMVEDIMLLGHHVCIRMTQVAQDT